MKSWCCVQWEGLVPELRQSKLDEIEKLTSGARGKVPRSVFYASESVLRDMGFFCPVCGQALLSQESKAQQTQQPKPAPKPVEKKKCPKCNGKKVFSVDENGIPTNCMNCFGLGFVDERHQIDDTGGGMKEIGDFKA